MPTLLTDDRVVRVSGTDPAGLLGYAESWLLLHYLMNEPVARIGFRRYLKAIRERETPDHRLDDASTHLGDLDRLNQQLHEYYSGALERAALRLRGTCNDVLDFLLSDFGFVFDFGFRISCFSSVSGVSHAARNAAVMAARGGRRLRRRLGSGTGRGSAQGRTKHRPLGTRSSSPSRRSARKPDSAASAAARPPTTWRSATPGTTSARSPSATAKRCGPISSTTTGPRASTSSTPEQRLTVVALADERSFAAFLGKEVYAKDAESKLDGVYQRGTNRLIVFDHRPRGPQLRTAPSRANRRTLAHEATHQLAYNTRLLDPRGDVPACIGEGLAMYGEVREPDGRTPPGAINRERLDGLAALLRQGFGWISLERLIADDVLVHGSAAACSHCSPTTRAGCLFII